MPTAAPPRLFVDPVEERLVRLYVSAEKRIGDLIEAAAERGAEGTERYYANQRLQVRREIERLAAQRPGLVDAVSRSAYLTGLGAVERTIDPGTAFTGVHVPAMEVVAANLANRLRFAEEFIGRQADDVFRRIGLEQTGLAIGSGLGAREQTRFTTAAFRRAGITAFVDRAGRRWTLGNYSRMVTRTTTREATTTGTLNRLREAGIDLVTISRHTGSCPICLPYQGKTYSITGLSDRYEKLPTTGIPPIHPNCRHVLYPATANFEEFERALGLGPEPVSAGQATLGGELAPPAPPDPVIQAIEELPPGSGLPSDAVNVSSRMKVAPAVNHASRLIDDVHSLPPSFRSDVRVATNSSMTSHGRFLSLDLAPGSGSSALIEVNGKLARPDQEATFVHEFGHFLDSRLTGTALRFGSEMVERNESPSDATRKAIFDAFRPVYGAIDGSAPIAALREAAVLRGPFAREERFGIPRYVRRKFLNYLLEPEERFARAYAQYITAKTGDPALLTGLANDGRNVSQRIWTTAEFAPIRAAFDAAFSQLHLLRTA